MVARAIWGMDVRFGAAFWVRERATNNKPQAFRVLLPRRTRTSKHWAVEWCPSSFQRRTLRTDSAAHRNRLTPSFCMKKSGQAALAEPDRASTSSSLRRIGLLMPIGLPWKKSKASVQVSGKRSGRAQQSESTAAASARLKQRSENGGFAFFRAGKPKGSGAIEQAEGSQRADRWRNSKRQEWGRTQPQKDRPWTWQKPGWRVRFVAGFSDHNLFLLR